MIDMARYVIQVLTFTSFEVETTGHDDCRYDYLTFYRGINNADRIGRRFCSDPGWQPQVTYNIAAGDALYMEFITDSSLLWTGFEIEIGYDASTLSRLHGC